MTRAPRRRPAREAANTFGLPTGAAIRALLRRWFRAQRRSALEAIGAPARGAKDVGDPADPLPPLPDFAGDAREIAPAFVPLLRAIWARAGRRMLLDLGLDPDAFDVADPNLARVIEAAALAFCEATLATTTGELADAAARTRRELAEGIVGRGEALRKLTARVNAVFDRAERWRARRIARTEASRAHHAAQVETSRESGVVAGFELLVSSDACPLCHAIAARHRYTRLGEPIAIIGDHPVYSTIRHPPLHPHCACALVAVLKPEYSGEPEPDWAPGPLVDPVPGPADYEAAGMDPPGAGAAEPTPTPETAT